MAFSDDVIRGYKDAAAALVVQYDAVPSATIYAPVVEYFPIPPATALDVGTGNGRDAAWLTGLGYSVRAVDPVAPFVAAAAARVPQAQITQDRLPELGSVAERYDLILVNAIWQHVDPNDRAAALARLAVLLLPAGRLILSLRHGPGHPTRPVAPVDTDETQRHAHAAGLRVLHRTETGSLQSGNIAAGVSWTWLVLMPASGSGSADGVRFRSG
ncbi:MAG: methyltransferase domain-containing protein [Pseudomonadota bacterium]